MKRIVWMFLFVLTGCVDSTTYLKNEKTGAVVTCGGVHSPTLVEGAVQRREAKCIDDYKEQGFMRVPKP